MLNKQYSRDSLWDEIDQQWDLIVIGGGITGAGIFREACRIGLKTLLVEQRDFSWGTSSRSSKLVHGGLRYLKEGKIGLTIASVQERERLLDEAPGLVDPLGFLLSIYEGDFPGRWTFEAGLTLYDLMALQWGHRYYSPEDFRMLAPHISETGLEGGFHYSDALTDDSRLVQRVLSEGVEDGGFAINYVKAKDLILTDGIVSGITLEDVVTGSQKQVHAETIVNATGAWADSLRVKLGKEKRIRPLRGSHLILPMWKLPVAQAVSFLHPFDGRPVMIFPWEGVTLIGTTDVDHNQDLLTEATISPEEVAYLMAAIHYQFPSIDIDVADVISTFSGVRAVIGSGKTDPSKESRDHVVWSEDGLVTVTGGKLTTFRRIAVDALHRILDSQHLTAQLNEDNPVLDPVDMSAWETSSAIIPADIRRRLAGRYGSKAFELIEKSASDELEFVAETRTLWAELRWSIRHEYVVHLDDLMLRRTRLGLIIKNGGKEVLEPILNIFIQELRWDHNRCIEEKERYIAIWNAHYTIPPTDQIPDYELKLKRIIRRKQRQNIRARRQGRQRKFSLSVLLIISAFIGLFLYLKYRKPESN